MKRYTQDEIASRHASLEKFGVFPDGNMGYLQVADEIVEIDFTHIDESDFLPVIIQRVFCAGENFGANQVRAQFKRVLGLTE